MRRAASPASSGGTVATAPLPARDSLDGSRTPLQRGADLLTDEFYRVLPRRGRRLVQELLQQRFRKRVVHEENHKVVGKAMIPSVAIGSVAFRHPVDLLGVAGCHVVDQADDGTAVVFEMRQPSGGPEGFVVRA